MPCPVTPPTIADLQLLSADVAMSYGEPVRGQLNGVVAEAGTVARVQGIFSRGDGCPIDCSTSLAAGDTVELRLREGLTTEIPFPVTGAFTNAPAGVVEAVVDFRSLPGPGIYNAEFAVLDVTTGIPKLITRFMLIVESSLWGPSDQSGPPTLAEIRLALRDSSPLESRLLGGSLMFSNSEILLAIRRPVDYWNETLPILDQKFDSRNFPSRYHWTLAASAILFSIAGEWYRKNSLATQSGGISVDDTSKANDYDRAYSQRWAEYAAWVKSRKISINMENCWGSPSFGYYGYYGSW